MIKQTMNNENKKRVSQEDKSQDRGTVVDFRWSRSEEIKRMDSLKFLGIHLQDDLFWTSLFSHQEDMKTSRRRIIEPSLPPLYDIHEDTAGGKGRFALTKLIEDLDSSYR